MKIKDAIISNYKHTFLDSLVPVINKRFAKGNIDHIELVPDAFPVSIKEIKLFDKNNNLIHDKDIERQIKKFWQFKKKAYEKNSDYYFPHKNKDQLHSIYHRSLGEDTYFPY